MKRLLLALAALPLLTSLGAAQSVRDIASRGACSTAGVEGLSAQLAEAQRCMNPGSFVRFAPHPGITLSSSRVHPYVQASARDALHRAAARVPLTINSAFRTVADQYVLYHSGGCGLAARPGRSNHQSGRAVDVQNWSGAKSTLQGQGCSWLGSRDAVHFDCPGGDERNDSVRAFQHLWNVNNPGDRIAEDGLYGPATESRLARTSARGFATGACDAPDMMPPPAGGRLVGVVHQGGDIDARIPGASVRIVETGASATADGSGSWRFDVPAGDYTVEASAPGYVTGTHRCTVASGDVWCSVGLAPGATTGLARGVVFEDFGAGFADTTARISGARVLVTETGASTTADIDGSWSLELPPGSHTLVFDHEGYAPASRRCDIGSGGESWCSAGLTPLARSGAIQGVVFEGDSLARRIVGVDVRIVENGASTRSREGDGFWRFDLAPGIYTVEASGPGFVAATRRCEVRADATTWCSVALRRDGRGGAVGDDLLVETVEDPSDVEDATEAVEESVEGDAPNLGDDPIRSGAVTSSCSAAGRGTLWPLALLLFLWRRRYSEAG